MGSDPWWKRDSSSRVPSFEREGSDPIIPAPRAGVVLVKKLIFLNEPPRRFAAPALTKAGSCSSGTFCAKPRMEGVE